jgi:hypothetical protein
LLNMNRMNVLEILLNGKGLILKIELSNTLIG